MMTQSVMTQAANLSRLSAGTKASRARQDSNGFETVMNHNLKKTDSMDTPERTSGAKSTQSKDRVEDTDNTEKKTPTDDDQNLVNDEPAVLDKDKAEKAQTDRKDTKGLTVFDQLKAAMEATAVTVTEAGTSADISDEGATQNFDHEELQEQILSILQSIQEAVMNLLQLTPEELETMLQNQGLELSDLADPAALQQLVMVDNGSSDVMDFLTNGEMTEKLNKLMEQVDAILKEADTVLTADQLKAAAAVVTAQTAQTSGKDIPVERMTQELELRTENQKSEKEADNGQVELKTGIGEEAETVITRQTSLEEGGKQASDHGKGNGGEQEAANRYETFLNNLTKASGDTVITGQGEEARVTELREIANQIIERIRIIMKPEQTSMELELNPEHLGKVSLTVQSKNGAMTAQFKVQDELVKEAIESQLQTLKDTLNSQGIKVEAIEVTVASYSFGQSSQSDKNGETSGQKKNQGQKISLADAISMSEDAEEEESLTDITGRGSNIDTTA